MSKKLSFINKEEKKEFGEFIKEVFNECDKQLLFMPLLNKVEKETLEEFLFFCFKKLKHDSTNKKDALDVIVKVMFKIVKKCISWRPGLRGDKNLYSMKVKYIGKAMIKKPVREKRILELTDKEKNFLYGGY